MLVLSETDLTVSKSEQGLAFLFSLQLLCAISHDNTPRQCFSNLSKEQSPFKEKKRKVTDPVYEFKLFLY